MSRTQQSLFKEKNYYGTSATHTGGKGEVFHDWYPYLEGFSSSFVSSVFEKYLSNAKKILDPFSGKLYSSSAADVVEIKKLQNQGLTVEQAINQMIREK